LEAEGDIAQVALLRLGPTTHNWAWGNEYVRLSFKTKKAGRRQVTGPKVPAGAIPGVYMLFVIDADGVPSLARRVHVGG
jgi:hypothetical protein